MSNPVEGCEPGAGCSSRKRLKRRSPVWEHFDETPCGQKAICKYCRNDFSASSSKAGTSHLKRHFESCQKGPKGDINKPVATGFQVEDAVRKSGLTKEKTWEMEVKKAILAEVPFATSDCKKVLYSLMAPMDVEEEIRKYYQREKEKLANELKNLKSRVSFSFEIMEKISYISLTAHFINEEFSLVNKLIGFKKLTDATLDSCVVGTIERCITDWRLGDKIFFFIGSQYVQQVRVDFPPLNKYCLFSPYGEMINLYTSIMYPLSFKGIDNIKEFVRSLRVPNGKDIFNQIAKEKGLPPRGRAWLDWDDKIDYWVLEWDDVERCERTVKMWKEAIVYKDVLSQYALTGKNTGQFKTGHLGGWELENGLSENANLSSLRTRTETGQPSISEINPYDINWVRVERVIKFSDLIRQIIDRLSSLKYPTSNLYFPCFVEIQESISSTKIDEFLNEKNLERFRAVLSRKIRIFMEQPIVLAACALDPRYKLAFLEYYKRENWEGLPEESPIEICKLRELFGEYALTNEFTITQSEGPSSNSAHPSNSTNAGFAEYKKERKKKKEKSELDEYLDEELVDLDDTSNFNLLGWWKENRSRYPVLSRMARDVLAIPALVYSIKDHINSDSRLLEGLSPELVEAVVCSKDWILSQVQSNPEPK